MMKVGLDNSGNSVLHKLRNKSVLQNVQLAFFSCSFPKPNRSSIPQKVTLSVKVNAITRRFLLFLDFPLMKPSMLPRNQEHKEAGYSSNDVKFLMFFLDDGSDFNNKGWLI